MPKSSKKGTPNAPAGANEAPELVEQLRESLRTGTEALRERIDVLVKRVKGSRYDREDSSHLAWLLKQAAQVLGEVRKLDDAKQRRLGKLTPALVLAYLHSIEKAERQEILRQAADIDGRGSGLA